MNPPAPPKRKDAPTVEVRQLTEAERNLALEAAAAGIGDRLVVVVAFIDIPPGNVAMYFPEANVLVPRRIDSASGTPAFKSIAARILVDVRD